MSDDNERYTYRSELLREAEKVTTQDRNQSYGEPDAHFKHVAKIANALGFRIDTGNGEIRELRASDHTVYMLAVKLSRLIFGDMAHRDSWVDIAGYAGCGYETVTLESKRREATNVAMPHPTKVDVVNGHFGNDVLDAAERAIIGDPADLEEQGFILLDSGWPGCSQRCANGHKFVDECQYRIKVRRAG